jgi:amidase
MAIHHFTPVVYHTTIGAHKPVLHVESGDTIVTTTIDAMGIDKHGEEVAAAGNPQTGPFYIDGAEPGHSLAVRFDKLSPNRNSGWSRNRIAANVLDPHYAENILLDNVILDWHIDNEAWTAALPDMFAGGKPFIVELDPMLGCFGTAPENGQLLSAAGSSNHGGNMDYRGFREGVTVYLPVYEEGAFFHLGDGHAFQGDGEILGTGIEVSFDVTFTVSIVDYRTIDWPRAEDETYIMTVGNARPLDQATQHATTEMLKWLNETGLSEQESHLLLGTYAEYDIGNIFDPAYTMVCKLRKKLFKDLELDWKGKSISTEAFLS